MNVADIPQEMLDKIRLQYEGNPEVRRLRTAQQYFQSIGKYKEALELAKTLEGLYTMVLHDYLEKAEKETIILDSEVTDLPPEDKEELMVKMMTIFIACDIIDSAMLDFNDVLHRTKPGVSLSVFTDMRQLSDMAKTKLKYFQKSGDYMQDLIWAEKCDNMYELIQSKAKSIIRKRKESKNWGENMKKLERK